MATAQRETNGTFTAVWKNQEGQRVSLPTGETLIERALKKAQTYEAEARFWEDQTAGMWQRLADSSFSPRYLHTVFIARAHMPFPVFRRLLSEASVAFKPPGAWRDRTRAKGKPSAKRYQINGESIDFDTLMERSRTGISRATLRFRLTQGWDPAEAIETPVLSRSESGRMGAKASNNPKGKAA